MTTLVDSSSIFNYLNRKGPTIERVREVVEAGDLVTNVIVRYEVLVMRFEAQGRRLLDGVPCRLFDRAAAEKAIEIAKQLYASRGRGAIGPRDTFIAAMALLHGDTILTANRSHFGRIAGLRIDPAST
jgi:predicted nucleic acid-binding protein